MANQEHLDILKKARSGSESRPGAWNWWRDAVQNWNKWRQEHPDIYPDLSGSDLSDCISLNGINLSNANCEEVHFSSTDIKYGNFHHANLTGAYMEFVDLEGANFSNAILCSTYFGGSNLDKTVFHASDLKGAVFNITEINNYELLSADLREVDFGEADLSETDLRGINFTGANLRCAKLRGADLSGSNLSEADLRGADLTNCVIYGISAWNTKIGENTQQKNLIITCDDEPTITIDNLEVAQFIYLLLNNQKIRDVINAITSKVVLILGRFTDERKLVLDALKDELRKYNYSPVVFDFDPSATRDLTEMISILAHMARFVIADLTDAKSIPQELQAIVPHLPSVPVQPILQGGTKEYAMFEHYERYPWVLPIYRYQDIPSLLTSIKEHIIKPVEHRMSEKEKTKELEEKVRMLEKKIRELERHS